MTRILAILLFALAALRCPAPVTLPPVGFDAGNWSSIATALNASQAAAPEIGSDLGGLHYIGTLNTGFACTAVASNQFATAAHVFPTGGPLNLGAVTYGGVGYYVTNRWQGSGTDFAILTIDGVVSNWTRINTNALTFPVNAIAWGTGQGFKPSDPVYTNAARIVFPVQSETAALRWGRRVITSLSGVYLLGQVDMGNTNANCALVGGDSGGPLFLLNAETGRHELIGTHYGATFVSLEVTHPTSTSYGYHNSAYYNRAGITAYLNAGDPPTNSAPAAVPVLIFQRLSVGSP